MTQSRGETQAVFLPGILMPAAVRYRSLFAALDEPGAVTKELEVYSGERPPDGFGVQTEVDGLEQFADYRGMSRFHLYGHSAGASIALAYVVQHGDRVLSLTLDEPATDFTPEDRALLAEEFPERLSNLPVPERMRAFAASLVRPGVEPPTPPAAPPGPESAKRPGGLLAWEAAMYGHDGASDALRRYSGPVLFTYGTLSTARWEAMANRQQALSARCEVERFDGLHHLNTSHWAEPARVAASLRRLWREAVPQ